MNVISEYIHIATEGNTDIIDITPDVVQKLVATKLQEGTVNISIAGSTASITTCEYEPGVIADLKAMYEKLIPRNKQYQHDNAWGDGNGHAHLRAALTGPSTTISFTAGKLCLGTWQQIIVLDFDNRPRQRKIQLQFIGQEQ
ncbi:secondary thiamine-phosphate synthase enzyme YjbQ [Candidatus Omnitrophota bacterium]